MKNLLNGYHYINYVSVKHASDAIRWASIKEDLNNIDSESVGILCNHHSTWAELTAPININWSISI